MERAELVIFQGQAKTVGQLAIPSFSSRHQRFLFLIWFATGFQLLTVVAFQFCFTIFCMLYILLWRNRYYRLNSILLLFWLFLHYLSVLCLFHDILFFFSGRPFWFSCECEYTTLYHICNDCSVIIPLWYSDNGL